MHGSPTKSNAPVEAVKVHLRFRPTNENEVKKEKRGRRYVNFTPIGWKMKDNKTCVQTTNTGEPLPRKDGRTYFKFDHVFGEQATNKEVYDVTTSHIVKDFVKGVSGSVICYGQTGSGKSYTVQGKGTITEGIVGGYGLLHLSIQSIFQEIATFPESYFLLRVSVIEVYNEEIRDLLEPDFDKDKKVYTVYDSKGGLSIDSTEEFVKNADDVYRVLTLVDEHKVVKKTDMNAKSSRSHVMYKFVLEKKEDGESKGGAVQVSTFNLIDLAGSDTNKRKLLKKSSSEENEIKKEGSSINKSLLALSHVISSISRSRKGFINFRDSNLTKLLQRDLKSQCRLSFVCCATPSGLCSDQTKKTIEFGKMVSGIKTKPSRNLTVDDKSVIIQTLTRLEQLQKNDTPDNVREKAELELKTVEEHLFLGAQSTFDLNPTDSKPIVRDECTDDSLSHILNEISSTITPADHESVCNTTGVMSEAEQKFLEMSDQWSAFKNGSPMSHVSGSCFSYSAGERAQNNTTERVQIPTEIEISDVSEPVKELDFSSHDFEDVNVIEQELKVSENGDDDLNTSIQLLGSFIDEDEESDDDLMVLSSGSEDSAENVEKKTPGNVEESSSIQINHENEVKPAKEIPIEKKSDTLHYHSEDSISSPSEKIFTNEEAKDEEMVSTSQIDEEGKREQNEDLGIQDEIKVSEVEEISDYQESNILERNSVENIENDDAGRKEETKNEKSVELLQMENSSLKRNISELLRSRDSKERELNNIDIENMKKTIALIKKEKDSIMSEANTTKLNLESKLDYETEKVSDLNLQNQKLQDQVSRLTQVVKDHSSTLLAAEEKTHLLTKDLKLQLSVKSEEMKDLEKALDSRQKELDELLLHTQKREEKLSAFSKQNKELTNELDLLKQKFESEIKPDNSEKIGSLMERVKNYEEENEMLLQELSEMKNTLRTQCEERDKALEQLSVNLAKEVDNKQYLERKILSLEKAAKFEKARRNKTDGSIDIQFSINSEDSEELSFQDSLDESHLIKDAAEERENSEKCTDEKCIITIKSDLKPIIEDSVDLETNDTRISNDAMISKEICHDTEEKENELELTTLKSSQTNDTRTADSTMITEEIFHDTEEKENKMEIIMLKPFASNDVDSHSDSTDIDEDIPKQENAEETVLPKEDENPKVSETRNDSMEEDCIELENDKENNSNEPKVSSRDITSFEKPLSPRKNVHPNEVTELCSKQDIEKLMSSKERFVIDETILKQWEHLSISFRNHCKEYGISP